MTGTPTVNHSFGPESCPSQSDLQAIANGDRPDVDLERLLEHVSSCQECDHKLGTIRGSRMASKAFGGENANDEFLDEPELHAAIERACELTDASCDTVEVPPLQPAANPMSEQQAASLDRTPQLNIDPTNGKPDDAGTRDGLSTATGIAAERYLLHEEIARGGMGVVLRGHDIQLGRDLAVKVLTRSLEDNPEAFQRFIEEAQIGGQLQHPGIVPVYDLGRLADNRPFIAMKLVKGRTLAELLKDHSSQQGELSKLLSIFEQICQTVGYAHSKNVVHRDLKPANIMVGAFGELQVMDWGLAKVLGSEPRPQESESAQAQSVIQTLRTSGATESSVSRMQTRSGSVLGTLAYMPPEQAVGDVDLVDTRADVFSLGAILCNILTGSPPYVSEKSGVLHRMAMKCDLRDCFERLQAADCDDALKMLTKACLAEVPENRLPNAGEVASQLRLYLDSVADRLRDAELEQAASEARAAEAVLTACAEQKRRRATGLLGVVGVLVCFAAAVIFGWIQQSKNSLRQAEVDAQLASLLHQQEISAKVELARQQIRSDLAIAESLLERSQGPRKPATSVMLRMRDATNRILQSLHDGNSIPELKQRYSNLAASVAEIEAAAQLIDRLVDVRIGLNEQALGATTSSAIYSSLGPSTREQDLSLPLTRTLDAFREWGVEPGSDPKQITRRVMSLPQWASPQIVAALHQLPGFHTKGTRFRSAMSMNWKALSAKKLQSEKGATLSQLDDMSILASGENFICDRYVIELALDDLTSISCIRLEALPHPSLPKNGPGRDPNGNASINSLRFELVPIEEVVDRDTEKENARSLAISVVEADFSFSQSPLRTTGWNLTGSTGNASNAIYFLKDTHSVSGADQRLRLVMKFQSSPQWGEQNLGRFRVSVLDNSNSNANASIAYLIPQILKELPSDEWQSALWPAIQSQDIPTLMKLARSDDLPNQPPAFVVALAEALNEFGEEHYVARLLEEAEWMHVPPTTIESTFCELKRMPDGSVQATQVLRTHGTYVLRWRASANVGKRPVAFRLETFDDGDGSTSKRNTRDCFIADISVSFAKGKTGIFSDQTIDRASANHSQQLDQRVCLAVDSSRSSVWNIQHPRNTPIRSAIVELETQPDFEFGGQISLTIETGLWLDPARASLRHFRISWASELPADVVDPRDTAYEILQAAYLLRPNDDPLLLALARHILRQPTPDFDEAVGFATAAVALRPDDPTTLGTFIRLARMQQPYPGTPLHQRMMGIARRSDQLTGTSEMVSAVAQDQLSLAKRYFSAKQYKDAAPFFMEAFNLQPSQFSEYANLAMCSAEAGDFQQAERFFREGIAKNPRNYWAHCHFGRFLLDRGRHNEAESELRVALGIDANEPTALHRLVELLLSDGRFVESRQIIEEQLMGINETIFLRYHLGLALSETDEIERALALFISQPEGSPNLTIYHLRAYLLLLASTGDNDKFAARLAFFCEGKQVMSEALATSLQSLVTEQFISLPVRSGQSSPFQIHQTKHLVTLARALSELYPENPTVLRTLAVALVKGGHWKEAGNVAEKITLTDDQPQGIEYFVLAGCGESSDNEMQALEYYRRAESLAVAVEIDEVTKTQMLDWLRLRPEIKSVATGDH